MQFLYNTHSISHCFLIIGFRNAYLYVYFSWYLKRSDTNINTRVNTNVKTETIYQTYKWEVLNKLTY